MNIQSGFRKRLLLLVLFAAVIAVCFYTISQVHRVPLMENGGRSFVKAQVVSIVQDHEQAGDIYIGDQTVQLKLLTGEHAGETVQATSSSAYLYGVHCTVGMKVIAIVSESGGELVTSVYGYNRAPALYAIVGLFLLSILIIGGQARSVRPSSACCLPLSASFGSFCPRCTAAGLPSWLLSSW